MQPTRIEWPLLLALGDRSSIPCIMNDLEIVKKEMDEDIVFVMEELIKKNQKYGENVGAPKVRKDAMCELAWQIDELTSMRKRLLCLSREVVGLFTPGVNLPLQMSKIRDELKYLIKSSVQIAELQRCKYNYQLLNFILDELMPWHVDVYVFSTLEDLLNVSEVSQRRL